MNHHLLNFMESASNQMIKDQEERILFKDWITSKREAVEEGTFDTYVQYYDLFISSGSL